MKDIAQKKCGCVTFQVGPPIPCEKHKAKEERTETAQLRRAIKQHALDLGHDLTDWVEYDSRPGKWTSFCHTCGSMAIMYDRPDMTLGDQVLGNALTKECN